MDEITYFKVGDIVYSQTWGKGKVIEINSNIYGVKVNFEGTIHFFTHNGKFLQGGNVSISKNPIPEIINEAYE